MSKKDLYEEFLRVAGTFNQELGITPVLYGSLGLQRVTGLDFSPQDIDLLVPVVYLEEKWEELLRIMEKLGYKMTDLHEHEFRKEKIKIGIAYMEDLLPFAGVNFNLLAFTEDSGAHYYTLTVSDYINVYSQSWKDGYRRTKNSGKDEKKLKILHSLLNEE
ncbi:hypothetical protein E2R51_16180 [Jeotgalibacillus sp. S-D1]|uniref:hypothetical protein n=1 Tax=Jeotgalibacillus sp. S-D1 TaxID=2552189 RepID=UPI001059C57F|nr:hypothetical protein [Jeotgalibacillus sp. S-D1]TDL30867.1 hypothetical protein E2R51_16180 [Jeotgalibacillus sp. S-D1]